MTVITKKFGQTRQITAHFLTQAGKVPGRSMRVSQPQQGQALQIGKVFADFVSKATFSLHIAIYDFRLTGQTGRAFVAALNERARSGVDVRIAYNHAKKDRTPEVFAWLGADPAPVGSAGFVGKLHPAIQRKGIADTAELEEPVRGEPIDPAAHLMHSKYIIRDGTLPSAAVLTGSTNFTNDAWSLQENNILIFERAPELARFYQNDFGEMWESGEIANSGRYDTGHVTVDGIPVSVAFSPGQGRQIDTDIAHTLSTARDRLLVASMVISSGPILGAIVDRAHRVREFAGIFDGTEMEGVIKDWARAGEASAGQQRHTGATSHRAHAQGHLTQTRRQHHDRRVHQRVRHMNSLAEVRSRAFYGKAHLFRSIAPLLHSKVSLPYSPKSPHNFMHDKLAVCDNTVITGSYNFSSNATRNAENVVIVRDQALANAYAEYVQVLMRDYPHRGLPGADPSERG